MGAAQAEVLLDLLRDGLSPHADVWDWLAGLARDAGLQREDLAGMTLEEAADAVRAAEAVYGLRSSVLHPLRVRVPHLGEAQARAAMVERLGLPLLAMSLPLSELRALRRYYRMDPHTWRWTPQQDFTLRLPTPRGVVHMEVRCQQR